MRRFIIYSVNRWFSTNLKNLKIKLAYARTVANAHLDKIIYVLVHDELLV